jgi:hypothetical protein
MSAPSKREVPIDEVSQQLVNYSVEREDSKQLAQHVPEGSKINAVAMEYEIQILKIVSVGWGISYFMAEGARKAELAQAFWNGMRDLAGNISTMSSAAAGKEIDYFDILKQRLDIYVKALQVYSDVQDPGPVIGHTFAKICGDEEDMYAMISGKRVFHLTLLGVKSYLESIEIV